MYTTIQLAKKFIQYYARASNSQGHGMHSPFVFDFIRNVLNNNNGYVAPEEIEHIRSGLLSDNRMITITDLGAGSRKAGGNQRTVSSLARTALKPKKYAQLLYRFARHYQPTTILELGSSLGITTSYLSKAVPSASIITIEGSPGIAAIAEENFLKLDCRNIRLIEGGFDELLPVALAEQSYFDLVFIDGNHRYKPTMDYFNQCLAKSGNNTVLIFDDIHWSREMEQAWEEIKSHPDVRYTIDIFFLGFVFLRKEFKVKQDFVVRF